MVMRGLIVPVAVLVLLAACGGGDGERIEALEEQVAELEAELEATAAPATTATPTAPATATPVATPTPALTAVPLSPPLVRYIGDTGGSGVSLRSSCREDARITGGWAEGTEVLIEQSGRDSCSGWSVALADGKASWVRDSYLVVTSPVVKRTAPVPTVTPSPVRAATVVQKSWTFKGVLLPPYANLARLEFCVEFAIAGVVRTECKDFFSGQEGASLSPAEQELFDGTFWINRCYYDEIFIGAPLPTCWQ